MDCNKTNQYVNGAAQIQICLQLCSIVKSNKYNLGIMVVRVKQ